MLPLGLRRTPLNVSIAAMLFALSTAAGFLSCAGKLGKIDSVQELPKDLPTDVKDKFEVRDASSVPMPAPASAKPVVAAKPNPKVKPAKGRAKAAAAPPVPEAFAYPSRRPSVEPIHVGESQVFEITYLGLPAGDFTLEVLPFKSVSSRKVYHVRGTAISSKVFSLFYRLNDTVETFIDYDGFFSHRFHLLLDETKQTRDSLELYDSEKKQTYYWNRWNHKTNGYSESKELTPIPPFPQDSLSSLFYIRSLPLVNGGVYQFPVVSEGKSWDAVVTVLGREDVDTPTGPRHAIKLLPETKYQGVLKKNGDSFVWVSDDDRRILLRLEAKVRIGAVVARLKEDRPGE